MKSNLSTMCADCGMAVSPGEYHPFAACLMFKACHDGDQVRANLDAVRNHSAQQDAEKVDAQPVAWLVSGPYQKQAFIMKSSAEAWCRGLNKGFEETAYSVSALYSQPDPAMAGDELSDKEIKELACKFKVAATTPHGIQWYGAASGGNHIGFARALLKRVQPASGEDARDAERYRFAAMHCVLGGGVYKFNWPVAPVGKKQFDKYIDAAMQQGGQP